MAQTRSRFYTGMTMVILLVVFVGFGPTYYLKGLGVIDYRALRWFEHVHAAFCTAWMALLLIQTSLVAVRRVDWHRRLGIAGVGLSAAMIPMFLVVFIASTHARNVAGIDDPDYTMLTAQLFWTNMLLLLSFLAFVTFGFYYRRRPETHKRLMLFAALTLMTPALERIDNWPILPRLPVALLVLPPLLVLIGAVFVHDVRVRSGPHPVSLIGAPVLLLSAVFVLFAVSRFEFLRTVVALF